MQLVRTTTKIETDELKPIIEEFISLENSEIYKRIAHEFIQTKEEIINQIKENIKGYPLLYTIKRELHDDTIKRQL